MENIPSDIRPLPTPAGYRRANPAVLPPPPVTDKARRLRRRRLFIGFSIAAALHAGAIAAWWLTPPLRLKASYAPERWVQVLPLPKPEAPASAVPTAEASKQQTRRTHEPTAVIKPPR